MKKVNTQKRKIKKAVYNTLLVVLMAVFVVSAFVVGKNFIAAKKSAESFNELREIIVSEPEADVEIDPVAKLLGRYKVVAEKNSDCVGWISIDGTNISYPVMFTPDRPNFYLKRGFDKKYSDYGVPYIDEKCTLWTKRRPSNNYIIYGHHMHNGSMFADLLNYAKQSYCDEHPIIRFDNMGELREYKIVYVFRYDVSNDTFLYNQYTNMDDAAFAEFSKNCAARSLYNTGESLEYGDQLITLSTCEHSFEDGRFVVVAKLVATYKPKSTSATA